MQLSLRIRLYLECPAHMLRFEWDIPVLPNLRSASFSRGLRKFSTETLEDSLLVSISAIAPDIDLLCKIMQPQPSH